MPAKIALAIICQNKIHSLLPSPQSGPIVRVIRKITSRQPWPNYQIRSLSQTSQMFPIPLAATPFYVAPLRGLDSSLLSVNA